MDFSLSEEHIELQKWVHEFAEREIRPVAAYYDETEEFPWPVLKKAAEAGLYSIDIYLQAHQDPTGLTLPIILEEAFWGCAGIGLALFGTGLPLSAVAAAGTPEQLFEWAPKMFGTPEDPKVAAFGVTEPQAGSDVRSLRTRAKRAGDEWVLNGQKVFISNGRYADVYVIVATVDPELGHRGQASFLITKDDPGIRPGKKEKKLGIRASDTSEVLLEDCRIPGDRVLGGMDRLEQKLDKARRGVLRALLGRSEDLRDDPALRGRPGGGHRTGRARVRDRLRQGTQDLRRANLSPPIHPEPPRRHGGRGRVRQAAGPQGGVDGGERAAV